MLSEGSILIFFSLSYRLGGGWGGGLVVLIPAGIGQQTGYTLDKTPAGLMFRGKQSHNLTFTSTGNLKLPVNLTCMSLGCMRKLEYLEGGIYHIL